MIIGTKRTILPIEILQSMASYSRSVALITAVDESGTSIAVGTGFLISKDLVITAGHLLGVKKNWPQLKFVIDFEFVQDSADSTFVDTAPYPWDDASASELHGILADAYADNSRRLQILQMAGIERRYLLTDGTPHRTWTQALDHAASAGKTREVIQTVLEDESVFGFHKSLRLLLKPESKLNGVPVELDPRHSIAQDTNNDVSVLGVLRLEKPISRSPVPLSSTSKVKVTDGVVIIQHPQGSHKQFILEPEGILSVDEQYVYYNADTQRGSSGAPVFDENLHVVAMHFFGSRDGNGGVRIDLIKEELSKNNLDFVDVDPDVPMLE